MYVVVDMERDMIIHEGSETECKIFVQNNNINRIDKYTYANKRDYAA
jgi:hypothetical protein